MKNSYKSILKRQFNTKWTKYLNMHFTEEEIQMAIKHNKTGQHLSVINFKTT